MTTPPGKFLCYGDYIYLGVTGLNGCDHGGLLGSEVTDIEAAKPVSGQSNTSEKNQNETKTKKPEDSLQQKTKTRSTGVSPILEKNGILQPPKSFFMTNIFEVASGVGFEAPGLPVLYGSQIKLSLISTGEYLHSDRISDKLDLITKYDFERSQVKECNFKIRPRHNVRAEGDKVYFKDLVLLYDFLGREIFCVSPTEVIANRFSYHNHGFRISHYLSYHTISEKALKGGDVIQIYHKVENCFLLAKSSYMDQIPSINILSLYQENTVLDKSNSYWQIETVSFDSDQDLNIQGILYHSSYIRLRHVLSEKYLCISSRTGLLTAIDLPEDDTVFELHLNVDMKDDENNDSLAQAKIPMGSQVRIYHKLTQSYLIIHLDHNTISNINSRGKIFGHSMNDYDKDVYQLLPVSNYRIEMILQMKKHKEILYDMLTRIKSKHLPNVEKYDLLYKVNTYLESLILPHGCFHEKMIDQHHETMDSTSSTTQKPTNKPLSSTTGHDQLIPTDDGNYSIAEELGFVYLLLEFSKAAFHRFQNKSKKRTLAQILSLENMVLNTIENKLSRHSYFILSLLLKHGSETVYSVIEYQGITTMIDHLVHILHVATWTPPLLEVISAIHSEMKHDENKLTDIELIFTTKHIEIIFDCIQQRLLKGEIPDKYLFKVLSALCKSGNGLISFHDSEDRIVHHSMQMIICEQLLGSPFANYTESPAYSMMVYRSAMASFAEDDISRQNVPSKQKNDKRLVFLTLPYGQSRPNYDVKRMPSLAIRPPSMPEDKVSTEDWMKVIALRNQIIPPLQRCDELPDYIPNMDLLMYGNELKRLAPTLNKLLHALEWKELWEMTEHELEYYAATLELMASICAGRNIWTQRVIQQFLPINHILYILTELNQRIVEIEPYYLKTNITPSEEYSNRLHSVHIPEDEDNEVEDKKLELYHLLLPIKTAMIGILFHCYIDCASLPTMPTNGKDSPYDIIHHFDLTYEKKDYLRILLQENQLKIFSLFTQYDIHYDLQIEFSNDMYLMDLSKLLNNVHLVSINEFFYYYHTDNVHDYTLLCQLLDEIQLEIKRYPSYELLRNIPTLLEKLIAFQQIQQYIFQKQNQYSLEQRSTLMSYIMYFIQHEAIDTWFQDIGHPFNQAASQIDHPLFHNSLFANSTTNNNDIKNFIKDEETIKIINHRSLQRLSRENNEHNYYSRKYNNSMDGQDPINAHRRQISILMAAGSTEETNTTSQESHLYPKSLTNPYYFQQVMHMKNHMDYFENMVSLIRVLLLYKFFDPQYHANPVYMMNTHPNPSSHSAKVNNTMDHFYSISPYLSNNKYYFKTIILNEDESGTNASSSSFHPVGPINPHELLILNRVESKPIALNRASNVTLLMHQIREKQKGPHHPFPPSSPNKANKSHSDSTKSMSEFSMIHDILQSFVTMLHPHQQKKQSTIFNISRYHRFHEDEKILDEFYNRQYGYVSDRIGLNDSIMNIKHMICKSLSVALDNLQVITKKKLKKIFYTIFRYIIEYKVEKESRLREELAEEHKYQNKKQASNNNTNNSNQHSINMNNSDPPTTGGEINDILNTTKADILRSIPFNVLKKLTNTITAFRWPSLSHTEAKTFRMKTWSELHMRLSRNSDVLWNNLDLFQEDTFDLLMNMIYYNNPQLRAELLHLIYRINSTRAEFSEYLMDELHILHDEEYPSTYYLSNQKYQIALIFARFGKYSSFPFLFPTEELNIFTPRDVMATLVAQNSPMRAQANGITPRSSSINIFASRELNQYSILTSYVVKLKRLLFNQDTIHGPLGLINFCYIDEYPVPPPSEVDRVRRAEVISMHSTPSDFLYLNANLDHQKLLHEFGFFEMFLSFVVENKNYLITSMKEYYLRQQYQSSSGMDPPPGGLHTGQTTPVPGSVDGQTHPLLEIYRLALLFLRVMLHSKDLITQQITSPEFMFTLHELRHYLPESIELLVAIIVLVPSSARNITESMYHSLLSDIKKSILSPALLNHGNSNKARHNNPSNPKPTDLILSNMTQILQLIALIVLSDIKYSTHRLYHLLAILYEPLSTQSDDVLLHRVLTLGLGIASFCPAPADTPSAILHIPTNSSATNSHSLQFHIKQFCIELMDIRFTCHQYQLDTNRITFLRLPKDILQDAILDETLYKKIKFAAKSWSLLPVTSSLKLHLDIMELLAKCGCQNTTLQIVIRNLFQQEELLFELLLIDKYEIKTVYLKVLLAGWFSRLRDQTVVAPSELLSAPIRSYMQSLLFTIAQDLRFFLQVLKDEEMDFLTSLSSTARLSSLSINKSSQLKNSLGCFVQHYQVLERYLRESVINFMSAFIECNMHDAMDDFYETYQDSLDFAPPLPTYSPSRQAKNLSHNVNPPPPLASTSESINNLMPLVEKSTATSVYSSSTAANTSPSLKVLTVAIAELFSEIILTAPMSWLESLNWRSLQKILSISSDEPYLKTSILKRALRFLDKVKNSKLPNSKASSTQVGPSNKDLIQLKESCLSEFIPEIDRFSVTNGYNGLNHLIRAPCPARIYVGDREYAVPIHLINDISAVSTTIGVSKYELIRNPYNLESFRHTETILSDYLIAYSYLRFEKRFELLLHDIDQLPRDQVGLVAGPGSRDLELNKLSQFMSRIKEEKQIQKSIDNFKNNEERAALSDSYDYEPTSMIDRANYNMFASCPIAYTSFMMMLGQNKLRPKYRLPRTHPHYKYLNHRPKRPHELDKVFEENEQYLAFSLLQFQRWTKRGGLLLELIIQHMLYCLSSYQQNHGLEKASVKFADFCKCNSYWSNVLTKGILRSRINDLYSAYSDQTETQMAQLDIEIRRLSLIQDVIEDLGGINVVVKQLSVSPKILGRYLDEMSLRSVHTMAIDLGTALNENGNPTIQDAVIDTIQDEYHRSMQTGLGSHFVSVIRSMLQYYTQLFLTKEGLTTNSTTEVVKLLRFLSLLCEGHNEKAQLYLGTHKLVTEVANFVVDMSKMLSNEMNSAMVTEDEISPKLQPKVLGVQRRIIRWINPIPAHNPDLANNDGNDTSKVKHPTNPSTMNKHRQQQKRAEFINIQRLSLLSEIVRAGLEALSEFCQGPRAEIQIIIARAGTTREFHNFFEFFGAYHLVQKFKPLSYHSKKQRINFARLYRNEVQAALTHETIQTLPPSEEVYWYGNDPLALNLIFASMLETSADSNLLMDSLGLIRETASSSLSILGHFFSSGGSNNVDTFHSDEIKKKHKQFNISQMKDWSNEKYQYIEYRKRQNKITEPLEGNYYEQILDFEKLLIDLEASCVKLTASLLEGGTATEETYEISTIVTENIGTENLICNMANFWDRYLHYDSVLHDIPPHECFERTLAYDYYALVRRIQDLNYEHHKHLRDMFHEWIHTTKIPVDEHIARIEVRGPGDNSLAVTYFPVPSLIKQYWYRGDIVELRNNIVFPSTTGNRDSADEKVKSFLRDGRDLIATLRHLESLDEIYAPHSYFFAFIVAIAHNINRWSNLTFLLTIAINIILIISVDDRHGQIGIFKHEYHAWLEAIGIAHLVSTSLTLFSFTIMYAWLYIKMGLKENPRCEFTVYGSAITKFAFFFNRMGLLGIEHVKPIGNMMKFRTWVTTASMVHIITHLDSLYYITLFIFSLLGNVKNPLFFSCCLMEVLRMSKLMQYVTKAFTVNIDQVLATIFLAAIIVYLFTTLSFSDNDLRNRYTFNGQGADGCYSLSTCLRLHLDYGMLQSVLWNYSSYIQTVQGEIFNFAFTFIMQIVIPGLISGIIIDTFSEMRGNKKAIEEDVVNTCFICNIDREDFETSNIPFLDHIKHDHNMWKYIWFMIYLDEKDHTEFDGIEQFCYEIIMKKDGSTRWLPLKMARSLSQMRDKYDLFTIYMKITSLQTNLEKMSGIIKSDVTLSEKNIREHIRNDLNNMETSLKETLKSFERKMMKATNHNQSYRKPSNVGGGANR